MSDRSGKKKDHIREHTATPRCLRLTYLRRYGTDDIRSTGQTLEQTGEDENLLIHGDNLLIRGDNLLIHGDNLEAMRILTPDYRGRVRMMYWDVPYNTGSDSFAYRDSLPRDAWLQFIKERVEAALPLMAEEDGQ